MALQFFGIGRRPRSMELPIPPPEELPEFPALPEELPEDSETEESDMLESPVEKLRSRAVAKEKQELEQPPSEPVFLKITAFKAVVDEVAQLRGGVERGEHLLGRLEALQQEEERALRQWREAARELHEKLIFVDEMLFKRR